MAPYNPIIPRQLAKWTTPVRYNIYWIKIFLSLSDIHAEVGRAIRKLYSTAELNRNAVLHTDDGLLHARMECFLTVNHIQEGDLIELVFSPLRSPGSRYDVMPLSKVRKRWKMEVIPHIKLRRVMSEIAARNGWERAVFCGEDGRPTLAPKFTLRQGARSFTVSARLTSMSESEFRTTYKLGDPSKR